jgi:hypothetical protein
MDVVPNALHWLQNRCKRQLQTGANAVFSTSGYNGMHVYDSSFLQHDLIYTFIVYYHGRSSTRNDEGRSTWIRMRCWGQVVLDDGLMMIHRVNPHRLKRQ